MPLDHHSEEPTAIRTDLGAIFILLLVWTVPHGIVCARMRSLQIDTSQHFFQLHGVNAAEEVVLRNKMRRKEMVALFKALAPTVIGIEACGASHHWEHRGGSARISDEVSVMETERRG